MTLDSQIPVWRGSERRELPHASPELANAMLVFRMCHLLPRSDQLRAMSRVRSRWKKRVRWPRSILPEVEVSVISSRHRLAAIHQRSFDPSPSGYPVSREHVIIRLRP
jgi:hypothetical protein